MRTILLILFSLFISCSGIDIYVKDIQPGEVKKIIIGTFEKRCLKYDPYIAITFSEALHFELMKLGYTVEKSSENAVSAGQPVASYENRIQEIMMKQSGDIFIDGIITEKEIGDAIDVRTSALIVLYLYSKSGIKTGESRYITSETLEDSEVIRDISSAFANKIHRRIR